MQRHKPVKQGKVSTRRDPAFVDAHLHKRNGDELKAGRVADKIGVTNSKPIRAMRAVHKNNNTLTLPVTSSYPVDTIVKKFEKGEYFFSDDLQRKNVWKLADRKDYLNDLLRFRAFDSIKLGNTKTNKKSIIDGRQRITTMSLFFKDKLKLNDGRSFSQLSDHEQTSLKSMTLPVVETDLPKSEWADISISANKGMRSSLGEILHARSSGNSVLATLEQLSANDDIAKLLGSSKRFRGYALLIRALALHSNWVNFKAVSISKFVEDWIVTDSKALTFNTERDIEWLFEMMKDHWSNERLSKFLYKEPNGRSKVAVASRVCLFIHLGLAMLSNIDDRTLSSKDRYKEYFIRAILLEMSSRLGDSLGAKNCETLDVYSKASLHLTEVLNHKNLRRNVDKLWKDQVAYPNDVCF